MEDTYVEPKDRIYCQVDLNWSSVGKRRYFVVPGYYRDLSGGDPDAYEEEWVSMYEKGFNVDVSAGEQIPDTHLLLGAINTGKLDEDEEESVIDDILEMRPYTSPSGVMFDDFPVAVSGEFLDSLESKPH